MGNENHLVAYLDILGFKKHVENYLNNDKESGEKILEKIKSAFKEASSSEYFSTFEHTEMEIGYRQFSDCICLSIPYSTDTQILILSLFLHLLRDFYIDMFKYEVYLRGGLSFGFHHEDEHIIFSEGLIRAYELELKSVYPRIILGDELIEIYKTLWEKKGDTLFFHGISKLLISDWDGTVFINPFNAWQSSERIFPKSMFEKQDFYDKKIDLKSNLIALDRIKQKELMKQIEKEINKLESGKEKDKNVLRKYIWLRELLIWNQDPEKAKIKFEYLLK